MYMHPLMDFHLIEYTYSALLMNAASHAILSREGMLLMRAAIQSNGLTELHRTWGGSHDFLLGCLLWLFDLPTYSFGR